MIFRGHLISKVLSWLMLVVFMLSDILSFSPAYAQTVLDLPAPGAMVSQSNAFVPVMLRAVKIRADQPLVFDFIIDSGNTKASREDMKRESEKIAKYFLASLTIPEKDLWVNLSPYENDRIIPELFGQTEMGRDLLAQDYLLKQLSASLVHPDNELGKAFWGRVYARAKSEFGTTDIPANTFNKIWIVPDKASVYEMNDTAIVGESHFKVMLEQDYLAMKRNMDSVNLGTNIISDNTVGQVSKLSSDVVRDILIPELEKEVNTGKNFAILRQIQNALILATWYKENLKESLLAQVYADKRKVAGVDVSDRAIKEKIYEQYIAAYREGVFNLIREDQDPLTQEVLPRKYFSGGYTAGNFEKLVRDNAQKVTTPEQIPQAFRQGVGDLDLVTIGVKDFAQLNTFRQELPERLALESLTPQSLPNLAFDLAKRLGKTLRTEGKDKDIVPGVSYLREGNQVTVFFTNGEPVVFEVQGQSLIIQTESKTGEEEGRLFVNMLTNNQRFANTGYVRPVTMSDIQASISSVPQTEVTDYRAEMAVAGRAVGLNEQQLPKVLVAETGAQETFGIAVVNGQLIVERALLQRIARLGNPYGMLTRTFIFAMAQGDWVAKKVQEYQWARQNFPELQTTEEFVYLGQFEQALRQEVNEDLLSNTALSPENRAKMENLLSDIRGRITSTIATVAVYLMNKEIQEGKSIFFPLAADPYHWGQMDTMFRAMMTAKTAAGILRLQGPDFRKILTLFTADHRIGMLDSLVDRQEMRRFLSMPRDMIGSVDGETQVIEYLIQHAYDFPELFEVYYLVGSDHMHFDVPSKTEFDTQGLALPAKLADQTNQPDTIRKLLTLLRQKVQALRDTLTAKETPLTAEETERLRRIETVLSRLDNKTMRVIPAFNERSPFDSTPVSGEQAGVEESLRSGSIVWTIGSNIPAASSTAIRNALAGIPGYEWSLAFLFKTTLNQIMENDVYRGWAIKLPDTIRRLAQGTKVEASDRLLFKNWLALARQRNPGLDAEAIGKMFTLSEEQIQEALAIKAKDANFKFEEKDARLAPQDVQAALAAVDNAQRFPEEIAEEFNKRVDELNGGIDLNAMAGKLTVERTGERIKVNVDPRLIERIKTQGVQGFKPVIINIMPINSMIPALGLNETPPGTKLNSSG